MACLLAVVIGGPGPIGQELALVGLVGGALAVASLRALYDIVGVVTFAQAHRAEELVRGRRSPVAALAEDDTPGDDRTDREPPATDERTADEPGWAHRLLSEPLRG
jgi:hypothetical protein